MSLTEYKRKRHFNRTPEPAGKRLKKNGWSYVIQKHRARQLHFDFRLELDGVLKSWAVPKGPSLDPSVKRLAMHVEDHPVDYGDFEGIIPEGEYGAGTVMLWDQGTWEPVGDARKDYESGRLKFQLRGKKLRGGWMLIRTGGSKAGRDQRQWLLFKERDEFAQPASKGDILDDEPLSVSSGRDLDEIANDADRVWGAKPKSNGKPQPRRDYPNRRTSVACQRKATGKAALPKDIHVQLATLSNEAPVARELHGHTAGHHKRRSA
jgi:bifunctional non-homologous end joining protein LigD